jgi:hypothetical protein
VRALVEGEVEVLAVRVAGGVERTFLSE